MTKLVCVDVDGTLVGSSRDVPPEVWPAAERLRARGIRLAICSGRPAFGESRTYAERLDATGWHAFQNGASLVHLPSGASRSAPIARATVSLLVERARSSNRILELYGDTEYAIESTELRGRQHADLLGIRFAPRAFETLRGEVVRAQWLLPIDQLELALSETYPGLETNASTSPVMPGVAFVMLTRAGIGKPSAIEALAREYEIDLADVMFIGDGHNDVEALKHVGYPVAMGNAEPEAKAVARTVVGHVDQGGLCEAFALV